MKNANTPSIKEKFLHFTRNKKSHLSLIGKNKSVNSLFSNIGRIYNPNPSSLKPFIHHNQSIRLMKSFPPYLLLQKNKSLKPSSSKYYMTGRKNNINITPASFLKETIPLNLPLFRTQIDNKYNQNNNNLRYKPKFSPKYKKKNEKKDNDDSPKLKYLGSIIKFKNAKKNLRKNIKKEIIPQEKRQDYIEFINKKRKLFFNPKSTSQFVHDKNSDYLIYSIKRTKSYQILQPNYSIKPRNPKEELIEMRDIVPNLPFNTQKLITQIRNLFSQDYKFNYSQFNESFYNNFENRVNFIDDIYRVPIFKNNLVKIILNKKELLGFEEWKNINVINTTTWNYLNMVKTKIQREKDEKIKKEIELELKKKEEEEYGFLIKKKKSKKKQKTKKAQNEKNNSSSSEEESDNNKKIIKEEENYSNIMMNVEKEEKLKEQQYEDLYIIEEYFLHKNNYDSGRVSIADDKIKEFFFYRKDSLVN